MPAVDMPLEQLKAYTGVLPPPQDIDAFWDSSLEEMRAVDTQTELRPAGFSAPGVECFGLFFTGVGGARIHARYMRPQNKKRCPVLLVFHGYSGASADWVVHLPFVYAGFCVAALDCRGQAGISEDNGSYSGSTFRGHLVRGLDDGPRGLLYRRTMLDTAQLADVVAALPEADPNKMAATGSSQGGGLALACAALVPAVGRVAAQHPFLSDYPRYWEMDLADGALGELIHFFRQRDPLHLRHEEMFKTMSYVDVKNLAHRIKAKVLMSTGLMDTSVPASTQFAVYNRLKCPKEMMIYPDYGHEGYPGWADRAYGFICE